jgi:hypothetical protein
VVNKELNSLNKAGTWNNMDKVEEEKEVGSK